MPPSNSEMLLTQMLSLLNLLMGVRIKGIAQGIPDDVNGDGGHRDGYPRKNQEPRGPCDIDARCGYHVPP